MTAPEPGPPATVRDPRWWVLFSVGLGTFMSALDGSIVNTILPLIQSGLGCTEATVQWVPQIYLLVVSGLLLLLGRLGDMRGHRAVYAGGFGVFILSSALCGLAVAVEWLIACRGLQSLGAAMIFASGPAILTRNFPAAQRGRALGLSAAMTFLGLTMGPSLGGWLAQAWGWRAVFYVNVPVGLFALACALRFIPRDAPDPSAERFDLVGALLFLLGLVALLFGLNRGHAWGWQAPGLHALLGGAVLLLVLFVLYERRVAHPMLDLSLFRNRLFSTAVSSALLHFIATSSALFLLPFYLLRVRHLTPSETGGLLTAQPVMMALVAPLSGALSDRVGSRIPSTLGAFTVAAGLFWLSTQDANASIYYSAGALAVVGLGAGLFSSPNNSALMGAAPRSRQGIAAAMLAEARNVGMALGIGLAGAILTTWLARRGPDALAGAVQAGLRTGAAIAVLSGLTSAVRGQEQGEGKA